MTIKIKYKFLAAGHISPRQISCSIYVLKNPSSNLILVCRLDKQSTFQGQRNSVIFIRHQLSVSNWRPVRATSLCFYSPTRELPGVVALVNISNGYFFREMATLSFTVKYQATQICCINVPHVCYHNSKGRAWIKKAKHMDHLLQLLYQGKPTLHQSEKPFRLAGIFCTKPTTEI